MENRLQPRLQGGPHPPLLMQQFMQGQCVHLSICSCSVWTKGKELGEPRGGTLHSSWSFLSVPHSCFLQWASFWASSETQLWHDL